MRKIAIIMTVLGLFVLAFSGSVYWLAKTDGGRDFALRQAQQAMPSGMQLQWKHVDGNFSDGLQFDQLSYSDETLRVEARKLNVSMHILPLLFRQLNIDTLEAEHVRVYLSKDDKPFEFPRWPESLPALDLPLSIALNKIDVEDLQLFREKKLLYALNEIHGDIALKPGSLRVSSLQATSEQGSIHINGYYQPNHDFATKLEGQVKLKTKSTGALPTLRLRADGNADRFVLDVEGTMPEPVRMHWQLSTKNRKPFWVLGASTEHFEPRALGFIDEHIYRVQLGASGDSERAQVVGELSRDGETVVIEPSVFSIAQDVIKFEDVHVLYADGAFGAKGSIDTATMTSKGLQLVVEHFPLPLPQDSESKSSPVVLDSVISLSGNMDAWQIKALGNLQRGKDAAKFDLAGTGSQQSLNLPKLLLTTDKGGMSGRFQTQWSPTLNFAFDGQLKQFDPSYFYPDYPGAISAQVNAKATHPVDKPWQGSVNIKQLAGNLRGRKLGGSADIRFVGIKLEGLADLQLGGSRVSLKGSGGEQLDVTVALQPLDLNDVNPNWQGLLKGTALLRGNKNNPDYSIDVTGQNLDALGYQAEQLSLQGNTISTKRTQLQASGLHIEGQIIDRFDLVLNGQLQDAGFQISAQQGARTLDGNGHMQWLEGNPRIRADTLHIDGIEAGIWHLQAPMQLQLRDTGYSFTTFCLQNTSHSAKVCAEDTGNAIAIDGTDFPLLLLEPWLNNAGKEFTYSGLASLKGELPKDFSLAGAGFVDLQVPILKVGVKPNTDNVVASFENISIQAKWLGNRISGKLFTQLQKGGSISGEFNTGVADNSALSGFLNVQIFRLDWLELFSLDISQPEGQITGDIDISGTRAAPIINGSYVLKNFNVQIPDLGLKLSDGQLTAKSTDNFAMLVKGSIKSGEGRVAITGVWDPAGQLEQPINLRFLGKSVALADTPDLQLTANTDLILSYEKGIYSLDGSLNLTKGLVNLESIDTEVSISNDVVVLDPVPEKAKRDLLKLSLVMDVTASEDVKVKGYGIDGTTSGHVAVYSPYDRPTKLTGTLKLLGKYKSYGQELAITRGNLAFSNSLVYEPRLDILTERIIEDEDISVGLEVTGSVSNPNTRLVSNPSMTDSEILSWLLFGRPLISINSSQAQAINTKSMAINAGGNILVGRLGRYVGLDQASISDSRALGGSTLTVGKQLSPKFFVSYGVSLLGIGQVITLKYLLKKGLDISIETESSETREQTSAALNWRK